MKYLIVGLGNIGAEYVDTRHNIGFIVLDAIANMAGAKWKQERLAFTTKVTYKGKILILVKPTTYMNLSGKAYKYWLAKENIPIEKSLVVVDDLDLDLGVLRLKPKGSGGTHNGLNDIIQTMGRSDYPRLRFGIGHDFAIGHQVDYVLGKFSKEDAKNLVPRIDQAIEMIQSFAKAGIKNTMNSYNNK